MAASRSIRVLLIDDSAAMRSFLKLVLMREPRIAVVGAAADGRAGLEAIERIEPDLVLLDIEMPGMDGLAVLEAMRERRLHLPVIMCSTLTQRGARVTLEALARGAADYVAKPGSQPGVAGTSPIESATASLASDLIPRILALCGRLQEPPPPSAPPLPALKGSAPEVVVLGVSTGGPAALDVLLPALPGSFPLPVLVVQHMPQVFTAELAERLNRRCTLRVTEALVGERILPGHVYIARGGWHMEAVAEPGTRLCRLRLTQGPEENHCRPSADVLFRSAAGAFGGAVLAAVLTGMGSDGVEGCRRVRAAGGTVLAQDRESSVVWGMPGAVVQAGLANRVLPLSAMAPELVRRSLPRPAREPRRTTEASA